MALARADRPELGNEGVYPPLSMMDSTGRLTDVEAGLAQASAALPSLITDRIPTQIRNQSIAFSLQSADAACAGKQA